MDAAMRDPLSDTSDLLLPARKEGQAPRAVTRSAAPIVFRLPSVFLALVLAALATLFTGAPAFAHAQLLASQPAATALLAEAPDAVRLDFNEPVSPLVLTLIAPDASSRTLAAIAAGNSLTIALPETLAPGTHVLNWRVSSADAHPIAGALVFSIGTATGAAGIAAPSPTTAMLLWLGKALLFATLFAGLGGAVFAAVFALAAPLPEPARRLVILLSAAGLAAAPLSLGLHGADALGLAPAAIFTGAAWAAAWATSYGLTVLCLAVAFILALSGLLWPRLVGLAWPAWLLAALALALSGHAGAASPQWLTRSAVALHIGGILFWVGALVPLWFWLRQHSEAADTALSRFSRLIPFAVAAILASGIILAVIQLGAPSRAWLTPYGYILAAKLVLLALLLALALWNRFRLTGPALAGAWSARLHLRRAILAELVLVLAIFGLAAGWRFTPPPRAIAQAEAVAARRQPANVHVMTDAIMADITVIPGHVGPVDVEIWLADAQGEVIAPQAVTVRFAAPALGIAPFSAAARQEGDFWYLDDQVVPLPGIWDVRLDIRISRFSLSTLTTQIDIQL